MVCATTPSQTIAEPPPFSRLSAFIVERTYAQAGCDSWNARRVRELMAKFGDTPTVMAARMRIRPKDFERRMEVDVWTKQDGLILTVLEQQIDWLRGGREPKQSLIAERT